MGGGEDNGTDGSMGGWAGGWVGGWVGGPDPQLGVRGIHKIAVYQTPDL